MSRVKESIPMFHAEKMRVDDFPFAVDLANTMDWNMAECDFEFMLKLEPEGCFVLFEDDKRIGIATCVSYGKLGWFGNLAVREEDRRKGAGTFLVNYAVDYLRAIGVETIGLYAYQHLIGFYENVGFKTHDEFVVLSGKVVPIEIARIVSKAKTADIPALLQFVKRCRGQNLQKIMKPLLANESNVCYVVIDREEIAGFVVAKNYDEMTELGPLLCKPDREDVAVDLLRTILQKLGGAKVFACVPANQEILFETLRVAGLREEFRVTRMFLGPIPPENCTYLPESLERG